MLHFQHPNKNVFSVGLSQINWTLLVIPQFQAGSCKIAVSKVAVADALKPTSDDR